MSKYKQDDLIVGLDIGTTKICAVVGEVTDDGIDIVGVGTYPSQGLRKGVVINIESTIKSIRKAIEEAEQMADCNIQTVYAGIAGGHIKGFNSSGMVTVKDRQIKQSDIKRVIHAAKSVNIALDREVIHLLPQEYIVDGQDGIKDPLGMHGLRMDAKVHIVTAAVTSAQNIIKCANGTGLNVSDIVLQQLASSEAVLEDEEKELGVALVDIGGGTTDIAIFNNGSIVHTAVIAVAGNHLTHDIAVGLRTPNSDAEKLKQKYGYAMASMVGKEETIEVPGIGGRKPKVLSRRLLCEIIEPRVEELFQLVRQDIEKTKYKDLLASGVVITGGASILEGIDVLAEEILEIPVRRGAPQGIGGLVDVVKSPKYATGVGLVLYGSQVQEKNLFRIREKNNIYRKVKNRMRQWLGEAF